MQQVAVHGVDLDELEPRPSVRGAGRPRTRRQWFQCRESRAKSDPVRRAGTERRLARQLANHPSSTPRRRPPSRSTSQTSPAPKRCCSKVPRRRAIPIDKAFSVSPLTRSHAARTTQFRSPIAPWVGRSSVALEHGHPRVWFRSYAHAPLGSLARPSCRAHRHLPHPGLALPTRHHGLRPWPGRLRQRLEANGM
jgi:hypothetical protein